MSITTDFLRGILFAFVVYTCYVLVGALWLGLYPEVQPVQAAGAGLLLGVYVVLLLGLLIRPDRSAKAVFIFLSLFCLLPIASALYWLNFPLSALPQSPFTRSFIASLFTSVAIAVIAYVHHKMRRRHQPA